MKTSDEIVDSICHILENCPDEWSYNNLKVIFSKGFYFESRNIFGGFDYSAFTCILKSGKPQEYYEIFDHSQAMKIYDSYLTGINNKKMDIQEWLENIL